jgi:predicted AAA+ superfamily ATPase
VYSHIGISHARLAAKKNRAAPANKTCTTRHGPCRQKACKINVDVDEFTGKILVMNATGLKTRYLAAYLPPDSSRRLGVVTGARQTGKTTLVKETYPDLHYVSLDAPENRDSLRQLVSAAWAATVGNAVIDEAQKEPTVFEKVKYAFDESSISFTVLTGSSQILLLKKIRESLAGRAYFFELWPLMPAEIAAPSSGKTLVTPMLDQLISAGSVGALLSDVPPVLMAEAAHPWSEAEKHLLAWGGMPALLALPEEERFTWLKNYTYTYLERDLMDLARMEDLQPFRKFQKLTALRSATLLNYSELARDAGISADTARRYLEYLRISYQTFLLQPFSENLTSSTVKTPKLYWSDVGIWRQLSGFRGEVTGQLFETMVVSEIVKWIRTRQMDAELTFYRTRSGMEVDLLIEAGKDLIGVEIKSRDSTARKDVGSLQALAEKLGKRWRGGMVVYRGNAISRIAAPDIWAVPSWRLFQPMAPGS